MPEFDSPKELARHLYDETVRPGDTTPERVRIASMAGRVAWHEWNKRVGEQ